MHLVLSSQPVIGVWYGISIFSTDERPKRATSQHYIRPADAQTRCLLHYTQVYILWNYVTDQALASSSFVYNNQMVAKFCSDWAHQISNWSVSAKNNIIKFFHHSPRRKTTQ
jgi:hypothetical protein